MANNGFVGYGILERYNIDTGEPTGETKPNTEFIGGELNEDYVAPVFNTSICPITNPDGQPPVVTNLAETNNSQTSISISWNSTDDVGVVSQTIYYQAAGGVLLTINVGGGVRNYTISDLVINTNYIIYITARDAANNVGTSDSLFTGTVKNLPTINISFDAFDTTQQACSSLSLTRLIFWDNQLNNGEVGATDKLFENIEGTLPFDGNNKFYTFNEDNQATSDSIIKVDSNGIITLKYDCSQSLSVIPSSKDVDDSAGIFSFSVTSNTTWNVFNNDSWIDINYSTVSGIGNDNTVSVDYSQNTTGNERIGSIVLRTTDGFTTRTISLRQFSDSLTFQQTLARNSSSIENACGGALLLTKYTDTESLGSASQLYENSNGDLEQITGYYSDGNIWRFWDIRTQSFTSSGICDFSGGGI
jgi:hypothetical protein